MWQSKNITSSESSANNLISIHVLNLNVRRKHTYSFIYIQCAVQSKNSFRYKVSISITCLSFWAWIYIWIGYEIFLTTLILFLLHSILWCLVIDFVSSCWVRLFFLMLVLFIINYLFFSLLLLLPDLITNEHSSWF